MSDQQLRDELEIRNLVARYSQAVGRRDEAAWAATWAEDGNWNVSGIQASGRESIVKTWTGLMDSFRFVTQLPSAGFVEVDADAATGRWHMLELGWPVNGDAMTTIGVYDDRYCRTSEGWRFASRAFEIFYMGPPDLSGPLMRT